MKRNYVLYIDEEIVWKVIKEQFPTLKSDIEKIRF